MREDGDASIVYKAGSNRQSMGWKRMGIMDIFFFVVTHRLKTLFFFLAKS